MYGKLFSKTTDDHVQEGNNNAPVNSHNYHTENIINKPHDDITIENQYFKPEK